MNDENIVNKELINLFNVPTLVVKVDTYWLYKKLMHDNYFNAHLLVKMLAIDCYYKKNDYGFDWYNEMQYKRVLSHNVIAKEMAFHEKEFIELIKSFEKNGYIDDYPIILNKHFDIFDGTHRLSLALYNGIKKVPVKIDEKSYNLIPKDYSFEWLEKNGMGYVKERALKKEKELEKIYK